MDCLNWNRRCMKACALVFVACLSKTVFAAPGTDGFVLFFDEYLYGDYYYASLGDVDRNDPYPIQPRKLRLPSPLKSNLEIGNADVSSDGTMIVFAARNTSDYDWNIYLGTLDLWRRRIVNVGIIVGDAGVRDEDPRFSWDSSQLVYKCDGNICIYPEIYSNPVVESPCELWSPAFERSGYVISYIERCGGPDSDRIWERNLLDGYGREVPNQGGGADRFPQYVDDGQLVYSHTDMATDTSSLWIHNAGTAMLLHDRTPSDDDPYLDKHDPDHLAFIGWENGGYNLFIYRHSRNDSVRLTNGIPILGPVLFR